MKTDRFEDLLRKKLENYTPDYRDEDLDRMFNHIRKHTSPSFWSQYGKLFSYTLAGITTVGLLTTIFFQYNQNQKLHDEIALLQKKEPKTEVITQTITKTDTVYVTKYITVPNNETEERSFAENEESESMNSHSETPAEIAKVGEIVTTNEVPKTDISTVFAEKNEVKIVGKEKLVSSKNDKKNNVGSKNANNERNIKLTDNQEVVSNSNVSNNTTFAGSEGVVIGTSATIVSNIPEKSIRDYSFNELSIKNWKEYYSTYDISKHKVRYRFKTPVVAVSQRKRPRYDYQFPDISLKNTKYRVGFGTELGYEKYGIAFWNEWLLNKHFSINFGLSAKQMEGDKFNDDREYNFKYGEKGITELPEKGQTENKDFRERHFPSLQPTNDIRDIHLINEIASIPLSLTYRGKLWKDYKWTLTAGTELDLYVKEKVEFGFQITNPLLTDKEYIKSTKYRILEPTLFNNYFVSAGVEKQFGKYVLQLSPYFTQKIKEANYRRGTFDYGFRFNVLYQFGKK